jgi:Carboxypeptidase regulatory-like domain
MKTRLAARVVRGGKQFHTHVSTRIVVVVMTLLLAMSVQQLAAQGIFGRISGTVSDPQGGAVAGAKILIVSEDTHLERTTTTDVNGYYVASDLPVGSYSVTAEQTGFKTVKSTGNDLVAGARLTVDLVLPVGEISQRVEVAAVAESVNTTSGELARTIDSNEVKDVALNGRNYMQLLSLLPGVAIQTDDELNLTTSLATNNQSVNGNRNDSNSLSVDGGYNLDSGSNSSQVNNVGVDFIREVAVKSSNFSAEYGRNSGASVNVVTRSGGDSFHGSVFEFIRNDVLDARDPTPGAVKGPLRFNDFGWDFGGPIKRGKLFFFGGQEWKRIRRFANAAVRTLPTSAEIDGDFSALLALPTPIQLHLPGKPGVPIPGNNISSLMTTDGKAIGAVYSGMRQVASSVTDNSTATASNGTFQPTNPFDWREDLVRIDYTVNRKHSLYGRYIHDNYNLIDPFGTFSQSGVLPTTPTNRLRPGYSFQLGEVWLITPQLINTAKINVSWNSQHIPPVGDRWKRTTYGFAFPTVFGGGLFPGGIPDVTVSPITGVPGPAPFEGPAFSLLSPVTDIAPSDDLTWQKRAHTFKTGVLVARNRKDQNGRPGLNGASYNGTVVFNSSNTNTTGDPFADALLGNYQQYTETSSDPIGHFRFTDVEAYVADTWRATRHLSLELGVRYQRPGPTYTQGNNVTSFDPSLYNPTQAVTVTSKNTIDTSKAGDRFNGLVRPGSGVPADQLGRVPNGNTPQVLAVPAGAPRGFYDAENLFAPRFGFSYSPFHDDRTAIRGGVGIFYDKPEGNIIYPLLNTPPFPQVASFQNGNLANPSGGSAPATALVPDLNSIDPHLKVARTMNYSLGVQRELPLGILFEVSYVGNDGWHLLRQPDVNQPSFAVLQANAALPASKQLTTNQLRPYLGYNRILMFLSDSTSNYNALQVYATKRKGDFMASVSYTFSKALTDASVLGAHSDDPVDRHYTYGVADFDRRNIFAVTYIYDAPLFRNRGGFVGAALGGWELSGITRAQSGQPITVQANAALGKGTNVSGRRANLVPGQAISVPHPSASEWFNPAAFANPSATSPGTSGVGSVLGPGFFATDLSLRKVFKLPREGMNLMFQADMFNTFNRANFVLGGLGNATLTVGSGNFGAVGGAVNPRNVQFGLKFNF